MNYAKREKIFSLLKKNIPNAKTELIYQSPFQLLIAVILSAQATDISVNKATKKYPKYHFRVLRLCRA